MTQSKEHYIESAYVTWLFKLITKDRYNGEISYKKLFLYLYGTEFRYSIPMDANRANDGISLRYRFACEHPRFRDADLYLNEPCNVLEMMVALALRCEETIMDDPAIGNRTQQWFWGMIVSLGLGSMSDDRYDVVKVKNIIERFLDHDYEPNGKGGLFTVNNPEGDLRDMQIWNQLCQYINSIT